MAPIAAAAPTTTNIAATAATRIAAATATAIRSRDQQHQKRCSSND